MVTDKDKTKDKYAKVSIPREMINEVGRIIEEDKSLGFVSVQEFVKEAVRGGIVKYRGIINSDEK